jgi:hypothetical protein
MPRSSALSPYPQLVSTLPSPDLDSIPSPNCAPSTTSASIVTRDLRIPGAFVVVPSATSFPLAFSPFLPDAVLPTPSSGHSQLCHMPGSFFPNASTSVSVDADLAATLAAGTFVSHDRLRRSHHSKTGSYIDTKPSLSKWKDLSNKPVEPPIGEIMRPDFHLSADVRASSLAYRRRQQIGLQRDRLREPDLVLYRRQEQQRVRRRALSLQRKELGLGARAVPTDPAPRPALPATVSQRFQSLGTSIKKTLSIRQRALPSEFARNFSAAVDAAPAQQERPVSKLPGLAAYSGRLLNLRLPTLLFPRNNLEDNFSTEPDVDLTPEPMMVLDVPSDIPGFTPEACSPARQQSIIDWITLVQNDINALKAQSREQVASQRNLGDFKPVLYEVMPGEIYLPSEPARPSGAVESPLQLLEKRVIQWRAQILKVSSHPCIFLRDLPRCCSLDLSNDPNHSSFLRHAGGGPQRYSHR